MQIAMRAAGVGIVLRRSARGRGGKHKQDRDNQFKQDRPSQRAHLTSDLTVPHVDEEGTKEAAQLNVQ